MKYMGSKSRIAKNIVPIIQSYIDKNNIETYVEPFVGGANVIDKIRCKRKIACDKQNYLIELYKNLDKLNKLPQFVTKEHYLDVRNSFNNKDNKYEDWYIGAIGFLASYNGRFFDGGYAGLVNTKIGTIRNYYDEAKRNLESQLGNLQGIEWYNGDYITLCSNANNSVIYCDPPYQGTTQYEISKDFDYNEFWDWCKSMSKNNIVLVSENNARNDFKCIWSQEVKRTIDNNKRTNSVEKLFTYRED